MKKFKNLFSVVCMLIVALVFGVCNTNISSSTVNALSGNNSYNFKTVSLENSDFSNDSGQNGLVETPSSGWSKIKSSNAISGVINVNKNDLIFAQNCEEYGLLPTENPGKMSESYDDNVLMINSKNSTTVQGYKSEAISLSAYSYYEISVLVNTQNGARASIYVTGLDEYTTEKTMITDITTNGWEEYTIFLQTNFHALSINLELYLGSTNEAGSINSVFFDNVSIIETTQERLNEDVGSAPSEKYCYIYLTQELIFDSSYNFLFEDTLEGSWEQIGTLDDEDVASRINLENDATMKEKGLVYLGTDQKYNSKNALVLFSEDKSYFGFKSLPFTIEQFEIVKISIMVKVDNIDGNVNINLVEQNDVNEFYGEDEDFYTPTTNTISVSSNTENVLTNDYTCVNFYVESHSLYNTSMVLELCLGSSEAGASGLVAFDNIFIEKLTYDQFKSVNASSYEKIVDLTTIKTESDFNNGNFADAHKNTLSIEYPMLVSDWTQTNCENNSNNIWGVVNTNTDKWDSNVTGLTSLENPTVYFNGIPTKIDNIDTNNVLMIKNPSQSYQTIKSPSFTVDKSSYCKLTFNYLAINTDSNANSILNVYLYNEDNIKIYEDLNVASNNWANYELLIKSELFSTEINIVFEVGTETSPVRGLVFLDNINTKTESLTDEQFLSYIEDNKNVIDLSGLALTLKGDKKDVAGTYEPLMFEKNIAVGDNNSVFGGIITENNEYTSFPTTHESYIKNMIIVGTNEIATYELTSKTSISLDGGSYYKFSVNIKTVFDNDNITNADSVYGAVFSLDGLTDAKLSKIRSNNDFTQYTIFAYIKDSSTINIQFAMVSDISESTGYALFDNFAYEKLTDKAIYKTATNTDTTLVYSSTSDPIEEEENTEEETTSNNGQVNIWIAISTIIMVLAFVIAIVGALLRKIEIKKYKVERIKEYDREKTIIRDYSIKEAQKRKTDIVNDYNKQIKDMEEYLNTLDERNRERLAEERKVQGKAITRKTEKEFRTYANTRTRVVKDIEKIKKQIEETETPEFLLKLEKQIKKEKIDQQIKGKNQDNKE